MTKEELLKSMADPYDPVPVSEEFDTGMGTPQELSVLDPTEYTPYMTPSGFIQIGWRLTSVGRASWKEVQDGSN